MQDEQMCKSYVFREGKCFFVSTIERDSSAMGGPERYSETLVWGYDWSKQERGKMRYQRDWMRGSLEQHLRVCRELFETGELKEEDD